MPREYETHNPYRSLDHDFTDTLNTIPKPTDDDWRKAGLVVAANAETNTEAADLLEMLGITDRLNGTDRGPTGDGTLTPPNSYQREPIRRSSKERADRYLTVPSPEDY